MKRYGIALALVWMGCVAAMAHGGPDAGWRGLIDRLAADGLDRAWVEQVFAGSGVEYQPSIMARKVDAMVRKQFEPRPAPTKKTLEASNYRQFLTPAAIEGGVRYIRDNQAAFARAKAQFGPPPELVCAFLMVETKLGSYLGDQDALSVLASLARASGLGQIAPYMKTLRGDAERSAYADWAAKDRSEWGYRELLALLRYARTKGQGPGTIPGSIYGAIGICQFMPSNALRFGVDGDGDGVLDLFTPADAIVSVASYLRGHGWEPNMTAAQRDKVVYAYNHSDLYVLAVTTVADRLKARLGGQ
jgi:membrane-bound lytic murein transglycosylase B